MSSYSDKLVAGSPFPDIKLHDLKNGMHTLGKPSGGATWHMVIIYRGRHCPLCTKFLNSLELLLPELAEIGIEVIASSADSKEQLQEHLTRLNVTFTFTYGLTEAQLRSLGLYISIPRSEQETDHNFAEPGLFVINEEGTVQVVDISNNPFSRPDLETMTSGLSWIRNPENNYPIRGTAPYLSGD
ncbi:thioredoxin peroxidase [Enterovibrio norvegicus FF-454]|uniref:Thioredoxin peroxidase n=1 Tax=Enterovibrio norvegicus FF-454 TaxID=1185651 RepID=A0A1E5BY71_9GAMM|nr:redoxin domain-containing protein [Enterovibrio norvegicus]OEE58217.1 thioredoxin peroxidase [Enterovibrio norvegicus FF-454]